MMIRLPRAPCYNGCMPIPDFEQQVLAALAHLTDGQERMEMRLKHVEEGQEEIKAHLTMQDAYLTQSFERITDMLGYEERLAELERQVAELRRR